MYRPAGPTSVTVPPLVDGRLGYEYAIPLTTRRASRRPFENTMRHNARHQRAQVLSMFLASVPTHRRLSSQKGAVLRGDLLQATDQKTVASANVKFQSAKC